MSKREAALNLYNALSGEPEQELEHAPLEKINSQSGINYILDQLRGPMSQRLVYQKGRFLADYENINRYLNEHLRAFVNRYRRVERNLDAVGITVSAMYDAGQAMAESTGPATGAGGIEVLFDRRGHLRIHDDAVPGLPSTSSRRD